MSQMLMSSILDDKSPFASYTYFKNVVFLGDLTCGQNLCRLSMFI